MTKKEFLESVNRNRYPKYNLSDVHTGKPHKEGAHIVLTETGGEYLAIFTRGTWMQAHFTSCENFNDENYRQKIYYDELKDKVIYWI